MLGTYRGRVRLEVVQNHIEDKGSDDKGRCGYLESLVVIEVNR